MTTLQPRSKRIVVRVTGDEYDRLLLAAVGNNTTMNEHCRIKLGLGISAEQIKKNQQRWAWGTKP